MKVEAHLYLTTSDPPAPDVLELDPEHLAPPTCLQHGQLEEYIRCLNQPFLDVNPGRGG